MDRRRKTLPVYGQAVLREASLFSFARWLLVSALVTSNGSLTTTQLVEMVTNMGETIKSLSVQNTTLDDVFVHYTGRQLRDEQVKAHGFVMPPRPGMQP